MAGVTNLFVKIRHWEEKAIGSDGLELSSGDPKTHPNVAEGARDQNKVPVELTDHFVCVGGVNLITLLRLSRNALMDQAERWLGANSVVDERCVYSSCFLLTLIHTTFFLQMGMYHFWAETCA